MVIFPLLFLRSLLHAPFHLCLSFLFIPFLYCFSYSFPGHVSIIILKENRGPNISLTDLVEHQNQTTFKIAVTAFLLWSVPLVPRHYHFRVESQLESAQYMEHDFLEYQVADVFTIGILVFFLGSQVISGPILTQRRLLQNGISVLCFQISLKVRCEVFYLISNV